MGCRKVEDKWDTSWICLYLCQRRLTPESLFWRVKWNTLQAQDTILEDVLWAMRKWLTRPTGVNDVRWFHLTDFTNQSQAECRRVFPQLALLWSPSQTQAIWSSSHGTIFGSFYWVFLKNCSLFWTTAVWRETPSRYLTSQQSGPKLLPLVLVPSLGITGFMGLGTWSHLWIAGSAL